MTDFRPTSTTSQGIPFQNPAWAYDADANSSYASLQVEGYISTIYDYFIFSENLSVTTVTLTVKVNGTLNSGFKEALGQDVYAQHAMAYTFGTIYSTALYSYSSFNLWTFGSPSSTYSLVVPVGANLNTLKVRFFTSAKPGDAGANASAEVYLYDLYVSAGSGGGGDPVTTNVSGKRILRCRPT